MTLKPATAGVAVLVQGECESSRLMRSRPAPELNVSSLQRSGQANDKVAQIRQVVRPLLERNSDLALVGRLIVVKPVRHLLLGVYIGRSPNPLRHVPTWSVILLSDVQKDFGFLWGERVRGRQRVWQTTDPDVSSAMCEAIEQEALAPMRSIKTFDDFIDLTSKLRNPRRHLDLFPIARLTVDIARGDLVAAEAICKYLKTKEGKSEYV